MQLNAHVLHKQGRSRASNNNKNCESFHSSGMNDSTSARFIQDKHRLNRKHTKLININIAPLIIANVATNVVG